MDRPTLETDRLLLRPYSPDDAAQLQRLAGDRDVAAMTRRIPHPYEDGMAEEFIAADRERFEKGESVTFAITIASSGELIGSVGLTLNREENQAELGYWIGKPYWNQGYATEASRAVVAYGFGTCGLERIHAWCVRRNVASGHVLSKLGMTCEGCLRQHFKRWGVREDLQCYGILRNEWKV